ncbi:MAG TPA: VWA domain-containing protein [Candidatus Sulfotelmatobacter sp.]|nr:VWA domain-containing protein [Candidatus Sulfotelmatobacter sp.]
MSPAPPAGSQTTAPSNSSEIATRDEPTFKVNVKLVLVRAVVRDSQGKAIGNLHKEDFQIFDKGKLQIVTQFSMEQPGSRLVSEQKSSESGSSSETSRGTNPPAIPEHFIAYLFDDVHLNFGDLAQVRSAADRHLASMRPSDRAAVFSTSGQAVLDFTDDREQLRQTLLRLQPRPVTGSGLQGCPDISYYMADLIVNRHDSQALNAATLDALVCQFQGDTKFLSAAQAVAEATASQQLVAGETESRLALGVLKDVVRRMSILPGQRSIVLVSPGFQTPQMEYDFMDIVDRALRSDIVVNAIDARGLYTVVPGGDISQQPNGSPLTQGIKNLYQMDSATADAFILGDLANSTGGFFFHNNNDLLEGFRRVAEMPEYYYVLGFSPQDMKPDGSFHTLKVKLANPEKWAVDARRGYYAAKRTTDPSEEAKREIEDELFSQEELHGLPVDLHTQFFKSSDAGARLSVLAHVDVKHLAFHKNDGRNRNDLTIVSGLFDRNGTYITGTEKILEMRLRDETLENKLNSGITVKTSFDVKPGNYLVRLVVRDAEKQLMSAESGVVQIP